MFRLISIIRPEIGRQPVVVRKRGGFVWELDLTEGIDFAIFLRGRFEADVQKTLRRLTRSGDTVCDIGANVGAHTLVLASLVGPMGTVLAFEPTEYAYSKLLKNLSLNPDLETVVRPFQIALARRQDVPSHNTYFSSWPLRKTHHRLHPFHGGLPRSAAGASIDTLDNIVRRQNLEHIDVIKIDVDGDELEILSGAADALARFRPAVVMEYAPYLHSDRPNDFSGALIDFVRENGYSIATLDGQEIPLDPDHLSRLVPHGAGRNVVLSPLE